MNTQITTPKSGSFWMCIIRSRRYKIHVTSSAFSFKYVKTWENFIFVRFLCWACNNQQTNIDQHSDGIIRLGDYWRHIPNLITYVVSNIHITISFEDNHFKFQKCSKHVILCSCSISLILIIATIGTFHHILAYICRMEVPADLSF